MTWESFYLTCFLVGLLLTLVTFVFGAHFHLPFHLHFPDGSHLPHFTNVHHAMGTDTHAISPFNVTTLMMFLTWFGGAGYLLTHYRAEAVGLALAGSTAVGLAGGGLMYLFVSRVFVANERPLRSEDFDMIGVLGRLSVPIREGGTGELIYSQEGTRRSCGARAENGFAIDRGIEVVVMKYDKGIAYVRRWDEIQQDGLEA